MQIRIFVLAASAVGILVNSAAAQQSLTDQIDTHIGQFESKNGYLSTYSEKKLDGEIDFQLAAQAYIWATPMVAMEGLRRGYLHDAGVAFKVVAVNDSYAAPLAKILTADERSINGIVFVDLGRDGPIVIDLPIGVYGIVNDCWERPIVEAGPFGPDKGRGGKFLLLPRNYSKAVPEGYFSAISQTNRAVFFGRARVRNGDVHAAADTLAQIRVYPLSLALNPPKNRVVRTGGRPISTLPPRGLKYWEFLADALNHEPVEEHDRFFHAMLKPLGIEKGKPFQPNERQKKILTDAAMGGFLVTHTISLAPR